MRKCGASELTRQNVEEERELQRATPSGWRWGLAPHACQTNVNRRLKRTAGQGGPFFRRSREHFGLKKVKGTWTVHARKLIYGVESRSLFYQLASFLFSSRDPARRER